MNPPSPKLRRTGTWTAERPFARNQLNFSSAKNLFFADENEIRFIWAVIRSAVLYSA
jgi:hypothetical protein